MRKFRYDFILTMATVGVLFLVSLLCIGGMFYFKLAELQNVAPHVKIAFQQRMNTFLAPLLAALLFILGICIPKRLLPSRWLYAFAALQVIFFTGGLVRYGTYGGLAAVLSLSVLFQSAVLLLTAAGKQLHFHYEGYWSRIGSSFIHFGFVLFCIDFLLLRHRALHLSVFWISASSLFAGLVMSFYFDGIVRTLRR